MAPIVTIPPLTGWFVAEDGTRHPLAGLGYHVLPQNVGSWMPPGTARIEFRLRYEITLERPLPGWEALRGSVLVERCDGTLLRSPLMLVQSEYVTARRGEPVEWRYTLTETEPVRRPVPLPAAEGAEELTLDALRTLLGSPGDGAVAAVRFDGEGGFSTN